MKKKKLINSAKKDTKMIPTFLFEKNNYFFFEYLEKNEQMVL